MQDNSKTYCVREAVLGLELNRPKSWICVALERPTSQCYHTRQWLKGTSQGPWINWINLSQDLITKSYIKQLRKYVFCFAVVVDIPFNFQGPCLLVNGHTNKLGLTARLGLTCCADFWAQLYNKEYTQLGQKNTAQPGFRKRWQLMHLRAH